MRVAMLFVGLVACTKPNPAVQCTDSGTCSDPAFPFCDVDGSKGGEPGTCIAVMCNAGDFGGCRGSDALVCDATGLTFDPMTCVNGCDATTGCVTCTPSTQSCANDTLTTCDASGVLGTQACALGCADTTRCADIAPSNDLGQFYDATPAPTDLDLENGTLEVDASTFTVGSVTMTLPSFDVPAPTNGAPIRVFVGKHVTLNAVDIVSLQGQLTKNGGRAIAFLATEDLDVIGPISVEPGSIDLAGCSGGVGVRTSNVRTGGGGGGHATSGAIGGVIPTSAVQPGTAGGVSGGPTLVPLRGGCPGAGATGTASGGNGGGAIQLVSRGTVTVQGVLRADGFDNSNNGNGGGGGGAILIEALSVVLADNAILLARGGGGGPGLSHPISPPPDNNTARPGGTCPTVGDIHCGNGGAGATSTVTATVGGNTGTPTDANNYAAGGGGGGVGRVRINTKDGSVMQAPTAVIAASTTTGVAAAR